MVRAPTVGKRHFKASFDSGLGAWLRRYNGCGFLRQAVRMLLRRSESARSVAKGESIRPFRFVARMAATWATTKNVAFGDLRLIDLLDGG